MLHDQLPQTYHFKEHIHFLIASVVRSAGAAELSPPLKATRGCNQGLPRAGFSSGDSVGKNLLPHCHGCQQLPFLLDMGFTAACFFKPARKRQQASRASLPAGQSLMHRNVFMDVTAHHHCHTLLVRSHSQVLSTLKEEGLYKAVNTQSRISGPPETLCTTKTIRIFTTSQW